MEYLFTDTMTAIIILNWNGWEDTVECLESLRQSDADFRVLVVDNGSDDDSVLHIGNYIQDNPYFHVELLQTHENYGFAKGNNEGIRYVAERWDADSYLLLNSDTIVEHDFLEKMQAFSNTFPEYKAITPLICYNSNRNLVWNCGGRLKWGFRKYYFAGAEVSAVKGEQIKQNKSFSYLDVTFLTGCALYFKPELLDESHKIFIEDFFFGEEDFNFCLRMNKAKHQMACLLDSKIYHKVSVSTSTKNKAGKMYIHYLNRYIDIRRSTSGVFYFLWACVNTIYALLLLVKNRYGIRGSIRIMTSVIKDSRRKQQVTREDFYEALRHNQG